MSDDNLLLYFIEHDYTEFVQGEEFSSVMIHVIISHLTFMTQRARLNDKASVRNYISERAYSYFPEFEEIMGFSL